LIFFDPNTTQTGDLDPLTLSADGQNLQFEFWATWSGRYGPLVFNLKRAQ